jgi:hypothetical protein
MSRPLVGQIAACYVASALASSRDTAGSITHRQARATSRAALST